MQTIGRRAFLTHSALTTLGVGMLGCAHRNVPDRGGDNAKQRVRVHVANKNHPLVARTAAILKDRIEQRSSAHVIESTGDPGLILTVDDALSAESFRIDAHDTAIRVCGGSPSGLLYGVGKFLRTSEYAGGEFNASAWRGTSSPRGSLRGMYFASHFHNWYHQASPPEIARYMEDLALWGVNAVKVIFPMINLHDWDDPQAASAMEMLRTYAKTAHELGIQFATGVNNTMFIGAPKEIRATPLPDPTRRRGNSGHPICPSVPEGHAYLMRNARRLYEELSDVGLDIVVFWPYDEGGCACAKCAPWGSNGYLNISRDFAELGRNYFPNLKSVLSTWMFDTPPEGEWQGLADSLAKGNEWLDYILADSHEDFPRYPLDHGVPGNLPLLNFPEISMWGNSPWGGVGANPLPSRYQRLWDQVKDVVQGGFPYSEGIYEDMNKAVVAQFYWDPDRTSRDTLAEYIAYEFGPGVTEDVQVIVADLELAASASYQKKPVDTAAVLRAAQLAENVHGRLPDWAKRNWRWEILHLRTILDRERFAGGGLESPAADAAMLRLVELYHCEIETDDPYHHRVRPPLKRAVDRQGRR
ncbi:MAG: hypothetical protein HUU46_03975 [Candidatus Hydrogenedentes bacterium]|nr:hypothetical protein [Candidatus Hydrogenedentota bacterium]